MAGKKTFVTLFPYCENSHLIKDIGQIPYFMHRLYDYDASVVSYKISSEYSHQHGEVKGLGLTFINNIGRFLFIELAVVKYLLMNAKKIDVFNPYHFVKQTFVYGILYKLLNPKGFLYIKLDAYNESIKSDVPYSTNRIKNYFLKRLEKITLKKVDLLSIESKEGEQLFKNKYPKIAGNTIYLPNGVNDLFLKEHFKTIKTFTQKENLIITTGRIGLSVKNHEMMLRSVAKTDLKNWKVYLIGPVHPPFLKFYDELCETQPQLKDKVFFTGEILNRAELYEWYNRAKIFCMTSPHESFGISLIEAMYFGNYVIGTEGISTMKEITNNQKHGNIVQLNDDYQLAGILTKLIENEQLISQKQNEIIDFTEENFYWSKITAKLNDTIINLSN